MLRYNQMEAQELAKLSRHLQLYPLWKLINCGYVLKAIPTETTLFLPSLLSSGYLDLPTRCSVRCGFAIAHFKHLFAESCCGLPHAHVQYPACVSCSLLLTPVSLSHFGQSAVVRYMLHFLQVVTLAFFGL